MTFGVVTERDYKQLYEDLVRRLDNQGGQGIYPMGHLTEEQRAAIKAEASDAYKLGWDDSIMDRHRFDMDLVTHIEGGTTDDETMLIASDLCFVGDDGSLTLNMNDTWGWALSWLPDVPKDEIPAVARLFRNYGAAGLKFWHSRKENNMRSEFADVNREIDFVRHEEEIVASTKSSSERAYKKVAYTLGEA
jgi:hypothetical protein